MPRLVVIWRVERACSAVHVPPSSWCLPCTLYLVHALRRPLLSGSGSGAQRACLGFQLAAAHFGRGAAGQDQDQDQDAVSRAWRCIVLQLCAAGLGWRAHAYCTAYGTPYAVCPMRPCCHAVRQLLRHGSSGERAPGAPWPSQFGGSKGGSAPGAQLASAPRQLGPSTGNTFRRATRAQPLLKRSCIDQTVRRCSCTEL